MKTSELRKRYLEFFKKKSHKVFSSDTLVPDDSTVFFTSAGMNQFKPYFLGDKKDIARAATCQKCLRTGDIEKVGKTAYHHTFFEMLGNFSFGDYFKKEAIEFAWEFLTKELNMKEKDFWVSVYKDDSQSYTFWKDHIGVPGNKIVKLGEGSNFWPANAPGAGPDGPCGPCSEIFFDKGKGTGCGKENCNPDCSCGRFVEVWNLVFVQFNRVGMNKLEPLPQRNIDTGMGLERMAAVIEGKESNFQIDILQPAVDLVKKILKVEKESREADSRINAIVDHARAAVFAIADGVYPSNEERGYVIRKIIRKASWNAHLLGRKKPFIDRLSPLFSELMGKVYPEIIDKQETIVKVIKAEEEKFLFTLKDGKEYLLGKIQNSQNKKQDKIEAREVFRLYDTYGFPLELTKDIAGKHNLGIDEQGFETLLKQQRVRSRGKSMFGKNVFISFKDSRLFEDGLSPTELDKQDFNLKEKSEFIGSDSLEAQVNIIRLFADGKEEKTISQPSEALIILDKSCFYPESGGQLGDKGIIKAKDGEFIVENTFKINEAILHRGRVVKGKIRSQKVFCSVDKERRSALERAHTATHLLGAALRKILGDHVTQQGSLVDVDRLRFDFTHFKALDKEELAKVEEMVNWYIVGADEIYKEILSYSEAKKQGALAFFKDKYQNRVRVVSVSDYSKELCGGTHLNNTAQAASFIIISESSISSGVRRIEAVVGNKAYFERLNQIKECNRNMEKMHKEITLLQKKNKVLEQVNITLRMKEEIKRAKKVIGGKCLLVYNFSRVTAFSLLHLADTVKKEIGPVFIFFTSSFPEKDIFICSGSGNFSAKRFVAGYKDELSLKGGGKEALVQGVIGEKKPDFFEKLENCFSKFIKL